jgi:hypothetical protein
VTSTATWRGQVGSSEEGIQLPIAKLPAEPQVYGECLAAPSAEEMLLAGLLSAMGGTPESDAGQSAGVAGEEASGASSKTQVIGRSKDLMKPGAIAKNEYNSPRPAGRRPRLAKGQLETQCRCAAAYAHPGCDGNSGRLPERSGWPVSERGAQLAQRSRLAVRPRIQQVESPTWQLG